MSSNHKRVGVLAVQGDFAAHSALLSRIGIEPREIRRGDELAELSGLIIPGGESTTILKFLDEEGLAEPIRKFVQSGRPVLGTCAGAIILADEVVSPVQDSLELIDLTIERNAYGRQVDSFIGEAQTTIAGGPIEAVFIRAPRIRRVGPEVEVLARLGNEPVLVRQANVFVATFHPELTSDTRVHQLAFGAA
ncbi:MAG TPA: pyridoxal 5'-phosphate synthase glutaminase subunit PdxT [Blastocatellia bacterium]|nr:pyridoxal 5'-phosphate synthase glutaminase subunit PdxT [Blastocatellia bacterium]